MNIVHQNSDIEQLSCTNGLRKEGSQICIQEPEKKQSWWTVKRIVIISVITSFILGALGVVLWYFLKDIGHNYYQGRINNYRTLGRNCVTQQHEDTSQQPVCYNQSIDSSIITLEVQPDVIFQALSIINITLIYDNGTSVYYGGFNFTETTQMDNQDIQELDDTDQIDNFPIFKTEVDPKTNTVKRVYVPIGLSPLVVQSAMQQLMHSNTAIQDPDNLTSITGINQINGAINKPRFDFNHSYLPKGVRVLKNVSKDDIVQRVDCLENTLDAQIQFNNDGEVVASRINGYQNIFQESLNNNSQFKLNLLTTTNQETTLVSSSDLQEIIDVVNKIIKKQNSSMYDSSNITIAYMTDEQKKVHDRIDQNSTQNRMLQNTISPPPEGSSFAYVKDKVLGSATVLGQKVSINLNVYGYRLSDSYLFYAQLVLLLNGQPIQILLQETQTVKDKNYSNSYNKEYNVNLVSFVFPVFGIPVSVDISTLFGWGYKINFSVQLPVINSYLEINGKFGLSAKAGVTVFVAQAGVGVDGIMANVKLPFTSNIDITKKTAYGLLQLYFSNDFRIYAFVQYWECKAWTERKCTRIFGKRYCIDVPKVACKYGDPKYLIQDKQVQTQKVFTLYEKTLTW